MSDSYNIENDRIEINDDEGNHLVFRPMAVIGNEEERLYIFSAVRDAQEDRPRELRLMLAKKDPSSGSASRYTICENTQELEQMIAPYLSQVIAAAAMHAADDEEDADEEFDEVETDGCDETHIPGEFCYCDRPEYLQ